jgi:hypothetical protein
MRLQTVLLILAIAVVVVFLVRRARASESGGYRRRLGTPPPARSEYVPTPIFTDGGAIGSHHLGHGTDCSPGATDGGGCADGGGSN